MAELTIEPATQLWKLQMARLDELAATHYANAVEGDIVTGSFCYGLLSFRAGSRASSTRTTGRSLI